MTPGWQVLVYAAALVAFVLAAVVAPSRHSRWWPTLVAIGLALTVLVPLWNANAVYD